MAEERKAKARCTERGMTWCMMPFCEGHRRMWSCEVLDGAHDKNLKWVSISSFCSCFSSGLDVANNGSPDNGNARDIFFDIAIVIAIL